MEEQNVKNVETTNETKPAVKMGLISKLIIVLVIIGLAIWIVIRLMYRETVDSVSLPVVNITHITRGNIEKDNSVIGTIMPGNTYYVINKVAGEITHIYVENGQHVNKGDKICDIDNQKQIDAAFIQYDTAKKTYDRMEKLYKSGDISKQSFESVKAQYDSYKLAYDTQVEYATPVATADGVIENTNMTLNVSIDTKTVLCYITSDEAKEIQFGVTERVLDGINLNDTVYVEKSGKKYEATVSDKATLISATTGLFNIKAIINDENSFASGVMAKVTFAYQKKNNVYMLSRDLIYHDDNVPYVYVVDDNNILHKKTIETGIENNEYMEITGGLTTDDKVVSTWNNSIAEGVEVEVIDTSSEGK